VRDDEVTIVSPRQRPHLALAVIVGLISYLWPGYYAALILVGTVPLVEGPLQAAGLIFITVVCSLLVSTLLFGHYIADHTQTTTMTASRSLLTISTKTWLKTRNCHWDRLMESWIDHAPTWLQIGTPGRAITFRDNRSLEEKRWLAEVLSQALRLKNPYPREPEELTVHYGSGPDARLKPGYLYAQIGVLSLRYHTEQQPDYAFFDPNLKGAASWARLALKQWPVSPDDLVGTNEDGWCWVHIVQGRISVTIGCEDQAALRWALDRFRGIAPTEMPPG